MDRKLATTLPDVENERKNLIRSAESSVEVELWRMGVRGHELLANSLEPSVNVNSSCSEDSISSAAIIFSLALVEQVRSHSSAGAISMFRLATSLLQGGYEENALSVTLTNNIGVWCFERGDMISTQRCMIHLAEILEGSLTASSVSDA